jgi:hypothetical protein
LYSLISLLRGTLESCTDLVASRRSRSEKLSNFVVTGDPRSRKAGRDTATEAQGTDSKSKSTDRPGSGAQGPAKAELTASAPFNAASSELAMARSEDTALLIAVIRMLGTLMQVG